MFYHYTDGMHLLSILRDSYLKPTIGFVSVDEHTRFVWFTTTSDWTTAARPSKLTLIDKQTGAVGRFDLKETDIEKIGGGIFRICLPDSHPLLTLAEMVTLNKKHLSTAVVQTIVDTTIEGQDIGDRPRDGWYGSPDPIPVSVWTCVEVKTPYGWKEFDYRPLLATVTADLSPFTTPNGWISFHWQSILYKAVAESPAIARSNCANYYRRKADQYAAMVAKYEEAVA